MSPKDLRPVHYIGSIENAYLEDYQLKGAWKPSPNLTTQPPVN